MKNIVFTVLIFILIKGNTFAQMPDYSKEIKSAMDDISIMEGKWEGKGWRTNRDGTKSASNVFENLYFKLDKTLLVLEGLGKNDEGEVVHNAYATISYNNFTKKYALKSFLSNGLSTDASFEVIEKNKKFKWWFKEPRGGTIRYSIRFENGTWIEEGEYSKDEKTWNKFFEMKLEKVM